jgi:hypothetical protein
MIGRRVSWNRPWPLSLCSLVTTPRRHIFLLCSVDAFVAARVGEGGELQTVGLRAVRSLFLVVAQWLQANASAQSLPM